MDSLSSLSPSIVLPPLPRSLSVTPPRLSNNSVLLHRLPSSLLGLRTSQYRSRSNMRQIVRGKSIGDGDDNIEEDARSEVDDESEEVERALNLDGTIPGTSDEFVKRVSSRAYDMRRNLQQTFDSSSYDVLDANPWREASKSVYVLTQRQNQICTMKTRRNRSEVEKELGLLFRGAGKNRESGKGKGKQTKQSKRETQFQMLVEDIIEGVLVFEDQNEAVRYCDLLQGGGQGCEGVAEIDASSVFDLCRKTRSLAVLFRRGQQPPLPQSLELNLRARKRSLED